MANTEARKQASSPVNVGLLLEQVAKKLSGSRALKKGVIRVQAIGPGGGDYGLVCSESGVRLLTGTSLGRLPIIEIIGDARRMQRILAGRQDACTQFLAGGFRLRGDLRYFSDLALELGILKEPL